MDTFGYTVKREPEEFDTQPATKKVKKEISANLDSLTWHAVKAELVKQEHEFWQEPNAKFKVKKENTRHVKEHKLQYPNDLKKKQVSKCDPYDELWRIRKSITRNISKGAFDRKNYYVAAWLLTPPDVLDSSHLIHSRWKDLTEEEFFQREIWYRFEILPKEKLMILSRELSDDLKACIPLQLEVRKDIYNDIRMVLERRLARRPKEDLLSAFAIYFRESQEDVKYHFPDMTRQEVYDTCLLRYGAMPRRKQKEYEEKREYENCRCSRHFGMYRKGGTTFLQPFTEPGDLKLNRLSKEEIEAYIKQMPRTTKVELVERGGGKFINVLDIKRYDNHMLVRQINCRWKNLTEKKNFQYEVTRAFGGRVIPVEDINVAWRNLGNDLRVKNLKQTRSKVAFFAKTQKKMERELKQDDVLYSFSSYFCEFENIIKTEFPDMTKVEVHDTCLLRYIAAPVRIRNIYEILSTREECKKLCNSRFGGTP